MTAAHARGEQVDDLRAAAILVLFALAGRALYLGQPILNIDEQFYLLVGDRMIQGALPYVDIWDRKPPVLFAIHALIRLLGGDGIWQAHLVAVLCVTAASFVIYRVALRLADSTGAIAAGIAYGWWMALAGGAINQAGVFFNVLMAAAALLLVQLIERTRSGAPILGRALGAMLLAGLAVQIKQSVVFEAALFGLVVALLAWRLRPPGVALGITALAAMAALLPSLAIVAIWRAAGHADALIFATVTSATLRTPMLAADYAWHLGTSLAMVLPLLAFAWLGIRRSGEQARHSSARAVRAFLIAWLVVGTLSLFAYDRTFYDHYLLGLMVPACILAAPAFADWRHYRLPLAATAVVLVGAVLALHWDERSKSGQWRTIAALDAATQGQRNCPFSYGGPAVAYLLNDWCLPTRYAFAGHLLFAAESPAIGVDPRAEVERILDSRPDRIILTAQPVAKGNGETRRRVMARVARDYEPVARIEPDGLLVYRLRPGAAPLVNEVELNPDGKIID